MLIPSSGLVIKDLEAYPGFRACYKGSLCLSRVPGLLERTFMLIPSSGLVIKDLEAYPGFQACYKGSLCLSRVPSLL